MRGDEEMGRWEGMGSLLMRRTAPTGHRDRWKADRHSVALLDRVVREWWLVYALFVRMNKAQVAAGAGFTLAFLVVVGCAGRSTWDSSSPTMHTVRLCNESEQELDFYVSASSPFGHKCHPLPPGRTRELQYSIRPGDPDLVISILKPLKMGGPITVLDARRPKRILKGEETRIVATNFTDFRLQLSFSGMGIEVTVELQPNRVLAGVLDFSKKTAEVSVVVHQAAVESDNGPDDENRKQE